MKPVIRWVGLGSALFALVGCGGDGGSGGAATATAAPVSSAPVGTSVLALQLGADLPAAPRRRIEDLLGRAANRSVEVRPAGEDLTGVLPPGSLVVAIGDTRTRTDLIPDADLAALGSEGFVVRSRDQGGVTSVAADGNRRQGHHGVANEGGLLYGAYALLEELGFGFLHPLEPTIPAGLDLAGPVDRAEEPHWPRRAWHLHTMHPIELTDLLNGWGPGGPGDAAGWRAQLPEWERFCEWAVANRQNEVEWVLLYAKSWEGFADGPVRQARFRELIDLAHGWGLAIGADAPLALEQQHAWTMIRSTGTLADEVAQIHDKVDWLMGAGFDFVTTEQGFSEFTTPDDRRMLAWMDELTDYVDARYGKETFVKVHVSQGQEAPSFTDPVTGGPLNFNFLPYYADPRLGVMPHTVQHYGLDDPAPTYGASGFGFMHDFMRNIAGTRPVMWYPETAYWVTFDVDVPLFLPVYAERRLHDLRLIAADERAGRMGRGALAGSRIDGQIVFSSGWEWGYWLNDVVAARAAWDPEAAAATDEEAFRRLLRPLLRPFGGAARDLEDALVAVVRDEQALLIEGRVGGVAPADVVKRNGQAYLQGWDTWDDVAELARLIPGLPAATTQPSKLGLVDMRNPFVGPDYPSEVEPLLAEMAAAFARHAAAFERLVPRVPAPARPLIEELADSARITALRAEQVHGLYDYVGGTGGGSAWKRARLDDARRALDDAAAVVARREQAYRVPADRIAGWRDNPTAYDFGYLWTVRSLHLWWRDEGKAVDAPLSPAYLNTIDPLDVAFGEGFWSPMTPIARQVGRRFNVGWLTDLLDAPSAEPRYPADLNGLRRRP